MPVSETSKKAYWSLEDLGKRQRQVFDTLYTFGAMTNRNIAKILMLEINSVTGRCKELRDKGFVEEKGRAIDPTTNKLVTVWGLVNDNQVSYE